jgi:hypothetical protein
MIRIGPNDDAGRIDQDVQPAIARHRRGNRPVAKARVADIANQWRAPAPVACAISSDSAALRSTITTLAPAAAKSRAQAAPIPEAAPVMSTTLLASPMGNSPVARILYLMRPNQTEIHPATGARLL